jgi:multidrug efflux pump subunit AcrA (membrane-fusion protein)
MVDTTAADSPEVLDQTARVTTTPAWLALGAVTGLVVAFSVWLFAGTLPQQLSATAVVNQPDGSYDVIAGVAGSVDVTVAAGDVVQAGQVVARVAPYAEPGAGAPARPVTTPVAGRVLEVDVDRGAGVTPADRIVMLDTGYNRSPRQVITYLPATDAARFRPGSAVTVTVSNLATSAIRDLPATVSSVAEVPSDFAAMTVSLHSAGLARQLLDAAGGIAYRVELALSGLESLGPLDQPADGQVVTLTNTYAEPHPIDLLLGRSQ